MQCHVMEAPSLQSSWGPIVQIKSQRYFTKFFQESVRHRTNKIMKNNRIEIKYLYFKITVKL
jgi:hypothetical protein